MSHAPLTLLAPAGVGAPTGGTVYDRELVAALTATGAPARLVEVPGPWPDDAPAAAERLLAAAPGPGPVLLDGLLASGAPAAVAALGSSRRVGVLAHLPVPLETGLPAARKERLGATEREALRAAHVVLCPSAWTARYLTGAYDLPPDALVVAHPGVSSRAGSGPGMCGPGGRTPHAAAPEPATPAPSAIPTITCLAALTPRKNAAALLDALAGSVDLPWRLVLAGPDDAAPSYAAELRGRARAADLRDRVEFPGALGGDALDRLWEATDLLALPSRAETFGMVVTEALARGIPAVVAADTGAQEALTVARGPAPGAAVPPAGWAPTLRAWLSDPALRAEWADAARRGAGRLPTWADTARVVAHALHHPTRGGPDG